MSGDSRQPNLISYPTGTAAGRPGGAGRWTRFGLFVVIGLLVLGGAGGYLWNQQEASPSADSGCDAVRTLARYAEFEAVATLAGRNSLLKELKDLPQFRTPASLDRGSALQQAIPAQESRVLFGYSGWEDALNLERDCFVSADLIFAETRIRMVRVLLGGI